jgi:hypothetical protein
MNVHNKGRKHHASSLPLHLSTPAPLQQFIYGLHDMLHSWVNARKGKTKNLRKMVLRGRTTKEGKKKLGGLLVVITFVTFRGVVQIEGDGT